MNSPLAKVLAVTLGGVLTCLGVEAAPEPEAIILKPYGKEFIFTAGSSRNIYVTTRDKARPGDKPRVALDNLSVGFGALPADLQELPEINFVVDQGYFENLLTNDGWPEIIVPPAE